MIDKKAYISQIKRKIQGWFLAHERTHLPWRKTRDPYRILVSEVMLQQTQVARVIPKYISFLEQFPTLQALAEASAGDVIRAWAGLGYNRRALFLQRTAEAVIREHGGKFPRDIETLKQLPGVGDYTARAILSFVFLEPVAMMDTNHRRFYQRVFFGLARQDDRTLLGQAERVIKKINPSPRRGGLGGVPRRTKDVRIKKNVYSWNQALMDFGSDVCLTRRPLCETCPVQKYCRAYPEILEKSAMETPKKKAIPFRESDRYFRGRIIARLREENIVSLPSFTKQFPELFPERLEYILAKLEKDRLIRREKRRILLA